MASAWDAFSTGVDAGAKLRDRMDARRAKRALYAGSDPFSGIQGLQNPPPPAPGAAPQPPMPGQASVPSQPPGPPPPIDASMLGAPPMGGMGAPPPTHMPLPGATPMPQAPPPTPIPQPMQQQQPPGGAPDAQQPPDPYVSGLGTLAQIAADIKRRNPHLSSVDLANAVDLAVSQAKGLDPAYSAYLRSLTQTGVQALRSQTSESNAWTRADAQRYVADVRRQTAIEVQAGRMTQAEAIAKIHEATAIAVANIGADSRRDVAGTNADARMGAAQIGANAGVQRANIAADASDYRAEESAGASDTRANAAVAGQTARAQGQAGIPITKAPNFRTAPGGGRRRSAGSQGSTPQYGSAADVAAAYRSGQITRDAATSILKQNGWAH